MSTKSYSRMLLVSEPVINLGGGRVLPPGEYPVEEIRAVTFYKGKPVEFPSRVLLRLTADQLVALGLPISPNLVSEEFNVQPFVGMTGVDVRNEPAA